MHNEWHTHDKLTTHNGPRNDDNEAFIACFIFCLNKNPALFVCVCRSCARTRIRTFTLFAVLEIIRRVKSVSEALNEGQEKVKQKNRESDTSCMGKAFGFCAICERICLLFALWSCPSFRKTFTELMRATLAVLPKNVE